MRHCFFLILPHLICALHTFMSDRVDKYVANALVASNDSTLKQFLSCTVEERADAADDAGDEPGNKQTIK